MKNPPGVSGFGAVGSGDTTFPSDSASANNPRPTALFYYFTAQFFLEFYGISLKPPEGDTAPFPEVK